MSAMLDVELESPVLPYNGTSGHSGSQTSHLRAVREDETGQTLSMQQMVMQWIAQSGYDGLTVFEARERAALMDKNKHHGTVSGALSNLHYEGKISRLRTMRGGCEPYVLTEWVDGRETVQHLRERKHQATVKRRNRVAAALWAHQFGGDPSMFYRTSEQFQKQFYGRADAAIAAYEEVTV